MQTIPTKEAVKQAIRELSAVGNSSSSSANSSKDRAEDGSEGGGKKNGSSSRNSLAKKNSGVFFTEEERQANKIFDHIRKKFNQTGENREESANQVRRLLHELETQLSNAYGDDAVTAKFRRNQKAEENKNFSSSVTGAMSNS